MTDLYDRFRSLDRIAPPDLWPEASRRAEGPSSFRAVNPVLQRPRIATQQGSWRRIAILASASLLVAVLLGLAIVVGSALLVPRPTTLVPPERGVFRPTGSPSGGFPPRHTATLLADGRVLVTHGDTAEVWDPVSDAFSATGSMPEGHEAASATLLEDGRVLVAGGYYSGYSDGPGATAYLWDPATDLFSATGALITPRAHHAATRLQDGRVLVVGGATGGGGRAVAAAELWDPAAGLFSPAGRLQRASEGNQAMLLPDGRVLVVGWWQPDSNVAGSVIAQTWIPLTATFSATGRLSDTNGTLTLLPDGRVLVTGGFVIVTEASPDASTMPSSATLRPAYAMPMTSAEIWDPTTGYVAPTGSAGVARLGPATTVLRDGRVLVIGGSTEMWGHEPFSAAAEIWDPTTGQFAATGSLVTPHYSPSTTLLRDGRVLVIGSGEDPVTAEVFQLR